VPHSNHAAVGQPFGLTCALNRALLVDSRSAARVVTTGR